MKHTLILKYITGIFNLRPPHPKLSNFWGAYTFLVLERIENNTLLPNTMLTRKFVILILLYGANKVSAICMFNVDNMTLMKLKI